ncbi:MAG: class I SAM-dependent methyltransferase [Clostridia bacterium]|nr:class I SAM-dependent methyltransferase [Clostridia bacterium]
MHKYEEAYYKGKFTVINCQTCGFKHLYPIPTPEELEEFYKHQYYTEVKPDWTKDQLEEQVFWDINHKDKLDTLNNLLGEKESRRILDIGCGNGLFLKLFQRYGWEVLGIEPSDTVAGYASEIGIPVLKDTIENIELNQVGLFDVANLSFVLEHVPNPADFLGTVYDLLKPGGLVCIEIPNEFNDLQMAINEALGKEMWWISAPDHINYFDFDSLEKLLTRLGFKVELRETSYPMELFILQGDDYVGNSEIGKRMHKKRVQFEKALVETGRNDVKRRLYQALANIGLGRSIIMYARK